MTAPRRERSGSASTPAARSPTSSPSTRTTGELVTTKTPSTPADPADGFMTGVDKVLDLLGLGGERRHRGQPRHDGRHQPAARGQGRATSASSPPRATSSCSRSPGSRCPTATATPTSGSSRRGSCRPTGCGPSAAGSTSPAPRSGRSTRRGAVAAARFFRDARHRHDRRLLPALLRRRRARAARCARCCAREHPDAVVSISLARCCASTASTSASMTTLVDAAVKPTVARYVANIARPAATSSAPRRAVLRDEVQRRRAVGRRGRAPADHHRAVRAGRRRAGRRADRRASAGFDRVLTCDGGGTSTDVTVVIDGEPTLTTEGTVGAYPSKIPMIDVVTVGAGGGSIAWLSPEGTLKVGPAVGRRRPRARSATAAAAPSRPSPTRTSCSAGSRRTCSAARSRSTSTRPRAGLDALGAAARARPGAGCATGILEISAWNQANALRQVTVKRGLDVRDFTLTTFGGSGLAAGLPADRHPRPAPACWCRRTRATSSAFGLLTVDVRNDYVQTAVARHADLDLDARGGGASTTCEGQAAAALDARGLRARPSSATQRTRGPALLRAGLRGAGRRCPTAPVDRRAGRRRSPTAFHDAHRAALRLRLPRRPAAGGRVGEPAGDRRSARSAARRCVELAPPATAAPDRAVTGHAPGVLRRLGRRRRSTTGRTSAPGDVVDGPGGHRGVRLDRAGAPGLRRHRRPLRQPADHGGAPMTGR